MQQRAEVLCVSQSKKGISEGASVDVIVVESVPTISSLQSSSRCFEYVLAGGAGHTCK